MTVGEARDGVVTFNAPEVYDLVSRRAWDAERFGRRRRGERRAILP